MPVFPHLKAAVKQEECLTGSSRTIDTHSGGECRTGGARGEARVSAGVDGTTYGSGRHGDTADAYDIPHWNGYESVLSADVRSFPLDRPSVRKEESHFPSALKALLMVPLFPLLGYCLMDQTGVSRFLMETGIIPQAILGEGFGHVGLCMSIHYLIQGIHSLGKGIAASFRL